MELEQGDEHDLSVFAALIHSFRWDRANERQILINLSVSRSRARFCPVAHILSRFWVLARESNSSRRIRSRRAIPGFLEEFHLYFSDART